MTAVGQARPQQAEHDPPGPIRSEEALEHLLGVHEVGGAGQIRGQPGADIVFGVIQRPVGAERHASPGFARRDLDDVELPGPERLDQRPAMRHIGFARYAGQVIAIAPATEVTSRLNCSSPAALVWMCLRILSMNIMRPPHSLRHPGSQ